MSRLLHTALLAVLATLLLLQPAVAAGVQCAEGMLSGACGCASGARAPDERASCCSSESDEESPADHDTARSSSACDCTLAPVPDAPAAPVHDGAGLTTAASRAWLDLGAQVSAAAVLAPFPAASDGSPPETDPRPHDLASRVDAARLLAFLCMSLR